MSVPAHFTPRIPCAQRETKTGRAPASRRCGHAVMLWVGLLFVAALPAAAQSVSTSAQAKARIITTLARFAQWPDSSFAAADTPLRLCVLHDSPGVAAAFAAHDNDRLSGRRLSVLLNPGTERAQCHLLFIDESAARSGAAALADVHAAFTLTVGLFDGFLAQGGMIELVNVNDAFRFDIDLRTLRNANLNVNPGVLKLARQVRS